MKFSILTCTFAFCILNFAFAPVAQAARLYLDPSQGFSTAGDELSMTLKLDTEGEEVNAIEATLTLPGDLISFRASPSSNSIVSLWVERPQVKGSTLKLTGIIPGGFRGLLLPGMENLGPGTVATFQFYAKKVGMGAVHIQSAKVIRNDGTGNAVSISTGDGRLEIREASSIGTSTEASLRVPDLSAPEPFAPVVVRSKYIHNGAWVVVFNTVDVGHGIGHYEVSEGGRRFERAESPYLLKDQSRTVTIEVKAIDYAGNERVETIPAELPTKFSSLAIAGLSLAIVVILTWAIRRTLTGKERRRL